MCCFSGGFRPQSELLVFFKKGVLICLEDVALNRNFRFPKQQRNVVVFTAKVSKRNLDKFQELMDSDAGLTVTRNWEGCTHLEAFYNEETETYFIYEYWDSYKQYEEYLDWRFNVEEPSFVQTVIPLVKGGENGMQAYYNNSTYNFY